MNRAMRRLRRGSSKVKPSQNGNRLDEVLCYGSTGNVSYFPVVMQLKFSQKLIDIVFYSRCREERVLVHQPFGYFVMGTYSFGQFYGH